MRRILIALAVLVCCVIAMPFVILGLLQTQSAREMVAERIGATLSQPGRVVTISPPSIGFDGAMRAQSLTVADESGVWLSARGIYAKWVPTALLGRRIKIGSVDIETIELARKPQDLGQPTTPAAERSDDAASLGALPVTIDVPSIRVGNIIIHEAVAGTPVRLTARAMLRLRPEPATIEAALHVRRDDDVAGRLDASLGYVQDNPFLRVDFDASEPSGGLIARLLRIESLPAVNINLTGDGQLDSWRGRMSVALDRRKTVSGKLNLTREDDTRRLVATLNGALADILPPGLRDIFAGSMHLVGTANLDNDFSLLGGRMEMASDAFTLKGSGGWERASDNLSVLLEGRLKRPATLGEGFGRIEAGTLAFRASADGRLEAAGFTAHIDGSGLSMPQGKIATLSADLQAHDANLRQEARSIPVTLKANADVTDLGDPKLTAFQGPLTVTGEATVGANRAVAIESLDVSSKAASFVLTGDYAPRTADLGGTLKINDLADLSRMAGRALAGTATLKFTVKGDPSLRIGKLAFDGHASDLDANDPRLGALLGKSAHISGTLSRDETGTVSLADIALTGTALQASVSGQTDFDTVAAKATVSVADLAGFEPKISGPLRLEATVSGPINTARLTATIASDRLMLSGEPVNDIVLKAQADAVEGQPSGSVKLSATYRGQPLSGSATFASGENGARRLDDIAFAAANARLKGHLALDAEGTPSGVIYISAPDLAEIAPLLLQEMSGKLEARAELGTDKGAAVARVSAQASDLTRGALRIASARLDATITDPLASPSINGTLVAKSIQQGGVTVDRLNAKATTDGSATQFDADADLEGGTLAMAGSLTPDSAGMAITLDKAAGSWRGISTRLAAPASVEFADGTARIEQAAFALGKGQLSVTGTAGETLAIDAKLENVPAEMGNAVAKGLGLGGTISGTAKMRGMAADPKVEWSLTWNGARTALADPYGLPAMTVKSEGQFADKRVTHTTTARVGGGTMNAKGSIGLAAQPASLDMTVNGTLPLDLARRRLLESGLRLDGSARLAMTIEGTVAKPDYDGTLSASGLTAVGLETGVVVRKLSLDAGFSPQQLEIRKLTGEIGGGALSGGGTIDLGGVPTADLSLKIDNATYQDGNLVTARFDADLKLAGPLAGAPKLSGTVTLHQTDITIPETIPNKISPLNVKHVNAPADVRQQTATLEREPGEGGGASGDIGLDLTVSAPSRMFVRGRGLQAELSGTIHVKGTTGSPVASGNFTLRRGTLGVLSRQLTFTKGTITFLGSFDPRLDFAATTSTSDAEVTVSVTGNASDPKITFSSSPDLPQDEILARLLFNQSLGNLSPSQVAQLASAVATLGGADPLERLRKSLGVDSISLTTDENNNAAVNIGKNIGDKLRLGVQQGTQGSGRVTVDIDINKTLRARGEVGEDGKSKAGIFFEKEY